MGLGVLRSATSRRRPAESRLSLGGDAPRRRRGHSRRRPAWGRRGCGYGAELEDRWVRTCGRPPERRAVGRAPPPRVPHLFGNVRKGRITFQHFSFLKRLYVTQVNRDLSQRAKPKPEPSTDPFLEKTAPAPAETLPRALGPVAPPCPPAPSAGGGAEGSEAASPAGPALGDERRWKEMELKLDDLPGVLARLSKIKLTGICGNLRDGIFRDLVGSRRTGG
uniref:Uncharacterized protein n=1 Tax=Ornithorhynchus anatinus TaxID=9258 RepID=A0A6I8N0X8_ORNAN